MKRKSGVVGLKTIWMGHNGRTVDSSHDKVVVGDGGMVLKVALTVKQRGAARETRVCRVHCQE